jgi:ribosomal protein S18 acetylase RimI-like enzyme
MALTEITIRPAREADLAGLTALLERSLEGTYRPIAADQVEAWLNRGAARAWLEVAWPTITLAELDGVVVGLVQPEPPDLVGELWIDPAHQGRGIGARLLRHAEQIIAAWGQTEARLTVFAHNHNARGFYRAQGWREAARSRHASWDVEIIGMVKRVRR